MITKVNANLQRAKHAAYLKTRVLCSLCSGNGHLFASELTSFVLKRVLSPKFPYKRINKTKVSLMLSKKVMKHMVENQPSGIIQQQLAYRDKLFFMVE